MLQTLRKVISTGTVTEEWNQAGVPERFRGEINVKHEICNICTKCIEICPVGALSLVDNKLNINHRACIFCGRCVEMCDKGALDHSQNYLLAELNGAEPKVLGGKLRKKIRNVLGRSLAIRHVDGGSCNACDWEMVALGNPIYDLQQYGIDFVASPRHADMLMVTGTVTRNLTQALKMTYEAVPDPKLVMAVGSCAASGQTFGKSYAVRGGTDAIVPVDIYVPGCPPRPQALIYGLLLALDRV